MPKTKEQKRKEAIERNRTLFSEKVAYYLEWQLGGKHFENAVKIKDRDYAVTCASKERIYFEKWCKSVNLDTHVNVI